MANDFKITAKDLDDFFNGQAPTKQYIMILNSPNNPTGAVYSDQEYK
jgi:aspartate/methionine/tyrosine aminotransferase